MVAQKGSPSPYYITVNNKNKMTHFKLTSEEIKLNNITLYRIELTKKCKWGNIGDK